MENDYISREAAFDALAPFCKTCRFSVNDKNCICCPHGHTRIKLNTIAAADVRPVVRAEWERPKGSTPRSWIFVCSKCGDRAYFPVPKYFPKGCGYSFCPNCGADMREVKTDEK